MTIRLQHTSDTMRLAATYLAIMLGVSLVFSFIMYRITARALVLQLRDPNGTEQTFVSTTGHIQGLPKSLDDTTRLGTGRDSLKQNLLVLNGGVVALGAPFCYVLARRTLRPMEEAMERQARFSSDAAHELRTPVAALRVRNEVALRDSALTLRQAKKIIKESVSQSIRLEELTESLLQLSRDQQPVKSTVPLNDVVPEAIALHSAAAHTKHLTISNQVTNHIVMANQHDVIQIISILLDNAIKYSEPNGRITLTANTDQQSVYVHVEDEGQGIRATDLPHIFERFYRADHARTGSTHSYGLGLSIANKLAAQNAGTLTVQSTLGKGSIFTLRLVAS